MHACRDGTHVSADADASGHAAVPVFSCLGISGRRRKLEGERIGLGGYCFGDYVDLMRFELFSWLATSMIPMQIET